MQATRKYMPQANWQKRSWSSLGCARCAQNCAPRSTWQAVTSKISNGWRLWITMSALQPPSGVGRHANFDKKLEGAGWWQFCKNEPNYQRAAVALPFQTGHSEDTHSPEAWTSVVVRRIRPLSLSIAVVCTVAISCWPRHLRTRSRPLESGA